VGPDGRKRSRGSRKRRLAEEDHLLGLREHPELGVEAALEGVLAQHAVAEAWKVEIAVSA